MWLARVVPHIARWALHIFYRWEVAGSLPPDGPLLLVANHPNMIADAAAVAAAARRPVRFLAKAPLFNHAIGGALLRSAGAIPIYRRQDDPTQVEKNDDSLRAAEKALASGSAVAIFPEGISHTSPAIAPLRTGAARIALGALKHDRRDPRLPAIIPIGLTYREKERFRSAAVAIVGPAVEWSDLSMEDHPDAVRQLTARIDDALRSVTINLESWEDAPAVETAEAIFAAEFRLSREPEDIIERRRGVAAALAALRRHDRDRAHDLLQRVSGFAHLLAELGVRPRHLNLQTRSSIALRWLSRRVPFFFIAIPIVVVVQIVFALPWIVVDLLSRRGSDVSRATVKILGGIGAYILWILGLSVFVFTRFGPLAAAASAIGLPLLAVTALLLGDRLLEYREEARRFLRLRSRDTLHGQLLLRRRELAQELEAVQRELGESR